MTLDPRNLSAGRPGTGIAPAPGARHRGQSLVEFALILPLLLLLVVIALDFGRIYLGYINVQNMARIAANEAANNPLAWSVTPDTSVQTKYRNKVLGDASATNCALPVTSGGDPIVPSPVFTDRNGDGTSVGLGDEVTVQLTCSFSVVTPIISNILGSQVQVTAESDFPVKSGITAVAPSGGGGGGGTPPTTAFIANSSVTAAAGTPGVLYAVGPDVIVDFRDSSAGAPSDWAWDFGDGVTSTSRDVAHEFECTMPDVFGYCTFLVEMTAGNLHGTGAPAYMTVLVLDATVANFTADRQVIDRGQSVTFTDSSTPGGTNFAWNFGDGTPVVSGPADNATHAYAAAGTYTVSLTVTYPAPIPPATVTKVGFITVNPGYCLVPSLTNVFFNSATAIWQGAPYNFTGTVQRSVGAPPGNFKIKAQSIAGGGGATALCSSNIYVSAP